MVITIFVKKPNKFDSSTVAGLTWLSISLELDSSNTNNGKIHFYVGSSIYSSRAPAAILIKFHQIYSKMLLEQSITKLLYSHNKT
jgi:hypothetical protein